MGAVHSLSPFYKNGLHLSAADASTLMAIGEHRGKQQLFRRQTRELLQFLRDHAILESIESSNRIEGVIAPRERIEAVVLMNSTPRDRAEQDHAPHVF
jgi:hypothetical protein